MGPAVRLCVHAFVGPVSALPAPLGDLPYPSRRKRRLFRLAIVSFAIGRRCSDPISNLSLHPSAYPPTPLFTNPYLLPPASPRVVIAEFPIQVSFVFLSGRDHRCSQRSHARSLILAPCPGPRLWQGQGRERTTTTRYEEESTVSRIKSPAASELGQGHVDPLELGPRRTLEARTIPREPRHHPQWDRPGPWVRCDCSHSPTLVPSGRG